MKRIACFIALVLSASLHAEENLTPEKLEGFTLPGLVSDAKASGFTECKDNYSSYRCTRSKKTVIFGVPASEAWVSINGLKNFEPSDDHGDGPKVSDLTPKQLSYRSINLKLDPESKSKLQQQLLERGWLADKNLNSAIFYKKNSSITINFYKSMTSIEPKSKHVTAQAFSKLESNDSSESERSSQSFIDSMKK